MVIEKLKKEDFVKYKELIDEAFDTNTDINSYSKYNPENESYEIVVIKENEDIIATLTMYKLNLFTFSFQPTIELFNVAVKKEFKRKGLGKLLIDYVKEYAKKNGYKTIHLTCLEEEKDVHLFYENVGFKKNESRKYSMYLGD